ncbi:C-X-C chemokine receptor type 3-like [Anoplopoma fimbria]|uniref:C-X-C chemokine receptor type 3-like n=1 Tax=Anoplopoma fimbria TaxID=229290 RepID=UPI0023EA9911|nr:C-X-C chemokine receptor type 3-like [Anoplopoma fimbria]
MTMDVDLGGIFSQNGTYDYDDNYEYIEEIEPRDSESVLIPVLYSVVLVVGLLGNGLLLAILGQKRRSWSISDTFVLHLCVADILLLVTLPFWAAQEAQRGGWCFGGFLCKISGAVFNINFYCGIFLLARFLSIFDATRLFSQKKPRLAHISCLTVWLVSLLLTIPDCVFLVVKKQEKWLCVHSYSQSATDWQLVSRVLHHTLGFMLPAVVLIICCCRVLLGLQCSADVPRKQKAVPFILPMILVFLLCWLPYNITLIVDTSRRLSKEPESSLKKALIVTSVLGCMHACLRPLLYFGLCGNFRKQTLAMFKRAKVETESSLWGLGVGEEAPSDQNPEGQVLNEMTSVDHQGPSTQC